MDFDVQIEPTEEFYTIYDDWCKQHKFPTVHIKNIEKIFTCYNFGIPIYSCLFWGTGSGMSMAGYIVSNPYSPKEYKEGGLENLMEGVAAHAKEMGYGLLWTLSSTKSIIESLKNTGFIEGDQNTNQFAKVL